MQPSRSSQPFQSPSPQQAPQTAYSSPLTPSPYPPAPPIASYPYGAAPPTTRATPDPPTPPSLASSEATASDYDEPEGMRAFLHERFFTVNTLNTPLRAAVGFVLGCAVTTALLIIFRPLLIPVIPAQLGTSDAGDVPLLTLLCIALFWNVGWSFALTGALHGNWRMRAVVFLVFLFVSLIRFVPNPFALVYEWPLLLLAYYLLVMLIIISYARRRKSTLPRFLPVLSFSIIFALSFLHEAAFDLLESLGGSAGLQDAALALILSTTSFGFLILPAYFLSGSDFVEWIEVSTGGVARTLQLRGRASWPLFLIVAAAAGAALVYGLAQRGDLQPPVLLSLLDIGQLALVGVIVLSIFAALARWGRLGRLTRARIPTSALVTSSLTVLGMTVLALMGLTVSETLTAGQVAAYAFERFAFQNSGFTFLAALPFLVGVCAGLPLLAIGRGSAQRRALATTGFFLVVFGTRSILLFLPNTLQVFGLPTQDMPIHLGPLHVSYTVFVLSLPVVQLICALFTLLYLVWLLVRRPDTTYVREMLVALFILNAGLQLIEWLSQLLKATNTISATALPTVAAVLLLAAFQWDLFTSGEQTNGDSPRAPRYARVLMYLGYSLLAISLTLFFSSLPESFGSVFNVEQWTEIGVTDLGAAMLLAGFVVAWQRARCKALNQQTEQ